MNNVCLWALPIIGLIGGFFSGFLGLGGGVVMLPLLTFIGGVPIKLATGTGLVQVFVASISGMISHYRSGMVDLKAGIILGLGGIGGGIVGSICSIYLNAIQLQIIYLLIILTATVFLSLPINFETREYRKGNFNKIPGVGIGFIVGFLGGLLGIGGGFIIIPMAIYLLEIPLRVTIGTSLLVIFISSFGTIWAKFKVGHIEPMITLLVVSGSIFGAFLGAQVSRKTPINLLRFFLVCILGLIFLTVLYKTFF